jgi:hypothetical protein
VVSLALQVPSISILSAGVALQWGIPLNVLMSEMGLGLFYNSWNIIDCAFRVSQITSIGSQFTVYLYVGATSILETSINTNLPSLNNTQPIKCSYSNPNIVCENVDAFTSTSMYFIKAKAFFKLGDQISNFGSIDIKTSDNKPLFIALTQNLGIPLIESSDYSDVTGFHQPSLNKETMVIGTPDNGLVNSTSTNLQ